MNLYLKYSFFAFLIISGIKLLVYFTHTQFTTPGIFSGLLSLLLFSIPLYFAFNEKRSRNEGGKISQTGVIKAGFVISSFSGVMVSAFTFVYYKYIDSETLAELVRRTEEYYTKENKAEEEMSAAIQSLKEFYAPMQQATGSLTGVLIAGLILSFILSFFIARNNTAKEA